MGITRAEATVEVRQSNENQKPALMKLITDLPEKGQSVPVLLEHAEAGEAVGLLVEELKSRQGADDNNQALNNLQGEIEKLTKELRIINQKLYSPHISPDAQKLVEKAMVFFYEGPNMIGCGVFIAPRVGVTTYHTFEDQAQGCVFAGYRINFETGKATEIGCRAERIDEDSDVLVFSTHKQYSFLAPAAQEARAGQSFCLCSGTAAMGLELSLEAGLSFTPVQCTRKVGQRYLYTTFSWKGDSGGPLVDWTGKLLGVHAMASNAMKELPPDVMKMPSPDQRAALLQTVLSFPEATSSLGQGVSSSAFPAVVPSASKAKDYKLPKLVEPEVNKKAEKKVDQAEKPQLRTAEKSQKLKGRPHSAGSSQKAPKRAKLSEEGTLGNNEADEGKLVRKLFESSEFQGTAGSHDSAASASLFSMVNYPDDPKEIGIAMAGPKEVSSPQATISSVTKAQDEACRKRLRIPEGGRMFIEHEQDTEAAPQEGLSAFLDQLRKKGEWN